MIGGVVHPSRLQTPATTSRGSLLDDDDRLGLSPSQLVLLISKDCEIPYTSGQTRRAPRILDNPAPPNPPPPKIHDTRPATMSGADSPEILAAYDAVRSDKDDTNWLIISYASPKTSQLTLAKTGTGGLAELATELDDSDVQYAYARVEYANDAESKRVKFVLIVWIGSGTKVMRKARAGIERGAVKKVLVHHSIEVDAAEPRDIDEADIVNRLRKAGGADYNGGRG